MYKLNKYTIIISIFFSTSIFSQNENTYRKIANEVCFCINDLELNSNNIIDKYLICLQNSAKKINKKIYNDLEKDGEEAYIHVLTIGKIMSENCPKRLREIHEKLEEEKSQIINNEDRMPKKETMNLNVSKLNGTISGFSGNDLKYILVDDINERTFKFIWLKPFSGDSELLKLGNSAIGKTVTINYQEIEIFNPNYNEYIKRNELVKIKF